MENNEQVNLRNMLINICMNILLGMMTLGMIYWVFIWDANLYNALISEDLRTWREWALIIGSIVLGPGIIIGLVQFTRSVWDGSMFDDHIPPRKKR